MRGGCITYTLTSELEQTGGTKVAIADNGTDLNWEQGDAIKVYCSNKKFSEFLLKEGNIFSGSIEDGATPLYAIFGGSGHSVSGQNLTFDIPQSINPQVGNITGGYFPAVAAIKNGNTAQFKNIFGLLRVDFSGIPSSGISKISLHDLAGNALCGTCTVPIANIGEGVATVTGGSNTLTMEFTTNNLLTGTSGKASVYFPVPAGALDDGFSIVLYDKNGAAYSFLQKVTGTAPVPRSEIRYISASISEKSEALDPNARGYYKSLFVNAGMNLDNHYLSTATPDENGKYGIPAIGAMADDEGLKDEHGKFYEYFASNEIVNFTESDVIEQRNVIVGNDLDRNGVLLYPDGSPRFRLVYCNGGNSPSHGKSLTKAGRDRFKTFFDNGGSYSGSCAGSFLASTYVDGNNKYNGSTESDNYTFGLFPGNLQHTTLPNMDKWGPVYTNMEIVDEGCKKYITIAEKISSIIYKNTSGEVIYQEEGYTGLKDVKHHGGSYLKEEDVTSEIEVLMRYRFSRTKKTEELKINGETIQDQYIYRYDNISNNEVFTNSSGKKVWSVGKGDDKGKYLISTWAYKPTIGNTGRIVCTGSHPEATDRDCDKQYTAFMFQYAMDGSDNTRVKENDLTMGVLRSMNETPSSYDSPETTNAPIGDRQYHHFKFTTTNETEKFVLRLDSGYDKNSGIDLYLGLRQGDKAWLSEADYTLCNKGGQKELHIKKLPAGDWYVSVFCATTVTQTLKTTFPKFTQYSGKTEVLNGIPYSIKIFQEGSTTGGGGTNPGGNWTSQTTD